MNHAKKMVLVPEHTFERLQQKNNVNTAPLTSRLHGLDHEIHDVLQNKQISDDEKVRQYTTTLQNYLTYYNQRRNQPLKMNIESTTKPKEKDQEKTENETSSESTDNTHVEETQIDDIVRTLPKTLKERGRLLLGTIRKNPDIVKWDNHGQVFFEGKPLKGSHIGDLIRDSLQSHKGKDPLGWEQFTKGLGQMNAPEHLIRNTKRRNALRQFKTGVEEAVSKEGSTTNDWFPSASSLSPKTPATPVKSKPPSKVKKQIQQQKRWLTLK